jgi:threonyl-tRNA synthetase
LQILQRFVEDEEERRGYQITKTPFMAKSDLYKISGHWQHYREGMFIIGDENKADEEEVLALRPMTCPFQFQAYLQKTRSYRDLPIRYGETSTLFRNESSGEMHGLIRVRQFTISEGHLVCAPSQLEQEFMNSLDLANFMLKAVGLDDDVSYRFSKWDPDNREKYIGDADQWEAVQNTMKQILDHMELDYETATGEAAFYGPKLDIQIKNVFGKEDTLITIQIDFQLAERFGMFLQTVMVRGKILISYIEPLLAAMSVRLRCFWKNTQARCRYGWHLNRVEFLQYLRSTRTPHMSWQLSFVWRV